MYDKQDVLKSCVLSQFAGGGFCVFFVNIRGIIEEV